MHERGPLIKPKILVKRKSICEALILNRQVLDSVKNGNCKKKKEEAFVKYFKYAKLFFSLSGFDWQI